TGPVDTIITLYDAAGNVLAENDDAVPGQGLNSRIDYVFATAGTYFLQVRDKRSHGGVGFSFTFALFFSPQPSPPPHGTRPPPPRSIPTRLLSRQRPEFALTHSSQTVFLRQPRRFW